MVTAALGWVGVVGTFSAYLLLCRGRIDAQSLTYSVLNCTGGLLGALASGMVGAWPSVASNLLWAALGLHAIVSTLVTRWRAGRLAPVVVLPLRPERDVEWVEGPTMTLTAVAS